MGKRIDIRVFRDGKFISDSYFLLKYDDHLDVVRNIYEKKGYTIEVIE